MNTQPASASSGDDLRIATGQLHDIERGMSQNQGNDIPTESDIMIAAQLLSFDNGVFRLCKEGLEILEAMDDPSVSVISIVGPKGIGKSYLANSLICRFKGKGVS